MDFTGALPPLLSFSYTKREMANVAQTYPRHAYLPTLTLGVVVSSLAAP